MINPLLQDANEVASRIFPLGSSIVIYFDDSKPKNKFQASIRSGFKPKPQYVDGPKRPTMDEALEALIEVARMEDAA